MNVRAAHRVYKIKPIIVNDVRVVDLVIDPHYEKNHSGHICDELILQLAQCLDGRYELPETKTGRYSYFVTLIYYGGKQYRLIWLMEVHAVYIGVVNAYRDRRRR